MKKTTQALILASTLAFSAGAMAQSGHTSNSAADKPDPSQTTMDGKNVSPDATSANVKSTNDASSSMSKSHSHSTSGKHDGNTKKKTASDGPSSMNTTKDGKTPAPDATSANVK